MREVRKHHCHKGIPAHDPHEWSQWGYTYSCNGAGDGLIHMSTRSSGLRRTRCGRPVGDLPDGDSWTTPPRWDAITCQPCKESR